MNRVRKVLVGVDFSPCSRSALVQAARIASRRDAELHLLHVLHPMVVRDLAEATSADANELRGHLVADARAELERLVTGLEIDRKTVTLHVGVGRPETQVLRRAEELPASLLVLGVYGSSGASVGASLLATRCVRRARTRVLLVNEDQHGPFRHVVAAVDFSETSSLALAQAIEVARADRAALRVVHVYAGPWNQFHYRAPTAESSPAFRAQYIARLQGLLDGQLEAHRDALGDLADVRADLVEHQGHGHGIIEYAKAETADLVVLGTEAGVRLRYLLLGSTAERVLREVPCSILAVKPSRDDVAA
ncbi:MAG: universal stress protein [Phycisphaerales bacterium]|nr:universal stress protein [Phycisphaerales bacterium]